LRTFGSQIYVSDAAGGSTVDEWQSVIAEDKTNPRPFSISLVSDKSIYDGRYVVTFNTTDKQSGLDHYEIMEEPLDHFNLFLWGALTAPWKTAQSPYLLTDQTLNSTIRVKAIDKAGNEYIAVYVPAEELRGVTDRGVFSLGLFLAGIVIILISLGSVIVYRRRISKYE